MASIPGDCGIKVSHKLFAPSIGIAYRVSDNFVIRAGYSLSPQQDNMGRSGIESYPVCSVIDHQRRYLVYPGGYGQRYRSTRHSPAGYR